MIKHSVWVSLQPHWESRSANIWHFKADGRRGRQSGVGTWRRLGKEQGATGQGDEDALVPKPDEAPRELEVVPSPPSDEEDPRTS